MARLDAVKDVIRKNYSLADCGLFFTRNCMGDRMSTLFDEGGVTVEICFNWAYFEVFGLTDSEQDELRTFYKSLKSE